MFVLLAVKSVSKSVSARTAKHVLDLAHEARKPGARDGLSYYTIAARCLSSVIVRVGRRLACRT
jgi:hypothetical protein